LGWGTGYTGGDLYKVIRRIDNAVPIKLDRWKVRIIETAILKGTKIILRKRIPVSSSGSILSTSKMHLSHSSATGSGLTTSPPPSRRLSPRKLNFSAKDDGELESPRYRHDRQEQKKRVKQDFCASKSLPALPDCSSTSKLKFESKSSAPLKGLANDQTNTSSPERY